MDPNSTLILGAGMAGLAAARTLAEAGHHVTLIEAATRVGGRIFTVRDGEEVIELGAEFIHGRPPELWSLIEEAGLQTYELDGPALAFEDGRLQPRNQDSTVEAEAASVLDPLETLPRDPLQALPGRDTAPDLTFAQYLEAHPEIPQDQRQASIGYVEGFNAADHRIISAQSLGIQQAAEDAIEGDRLFRIREGYDALPNYLARKFAEAGGQLHLSTLVTRVEWNPGHVRVFATQDGRPAAFEAAQAIIALPLGTLHQQSVEFVPVPDSIREARRLQMGQVRRFTLVFREKFWAPAPSQIGSPNEASDLLSSGRDQAPPQPGDFSFLFSFGSMPPVWWTPLPQPSCTLTGWVGGPRSAALAHLSPDHLGRQACETLAEIFSLPAEHLRSLLRATWTHDWQTDGLTFGAYSYVPAGALDASTKMTVAADGTLFFAGEHTDTTGHWGTVHAAYRSGLRAARQLLNP